MKLILKLTIFVLVTLSSKSLLSQCKIVSKSETCQNDLVLFNLTIPVGTKIKSCDWDFGDGNTSKDTTPSHIYTKTGKFTIKCKTVLTSNNTCDAASTIEVFGLPETKFEFTNILDTCQFSNNIGVIDKSKEFNSNQPLVKRLVIWGNSEYDYYANPKYDEKCYKKYNVSGTFKVSMEITDKKGCHTSIDKYIKIVPGVKSVITTSINSKDCFAPEFCYKNSSIGVGNGIKYTWNISGKAPFNDTPPQTHCERPKKTTTFKGKLEVTNDFGCISVDTFSVLVIAGPKGKVEIQNDTICFNTIKHPTFKYKNFPNGFLINWLIDNQYVGKDTILDVNQANARLNPGTHIVRCELISTNCNYTEYFKIIVNGPKANPFVFVQDQCGYDNKVLLADQTILTDKSKATWRWDITDKFGDKCVSNRTKGINKSLNCNTSIDWFTKHKYSEAASNLVYFKVTDNVTGCTDSTVLTVRTDACGRLTPNTQKAPVSICQGDLFLPGQLSTFDPDSFSLDSGKKWILFPSNLNDKYVGLYRVSLKFIPKGPIALKEIGDDSIDVIFNKKQFFYITNNYYLNILPRPNSDFNIIQNNDCKSSKVILKLIDNNIKNGDSLLVYWGDNTITKVYGNSNYQLDSLEHSYLTKKTYTITVNRTNSRFCKSVKSKIVRFGRDLEIIPTNTCLGKNATIQIKVFDGFSTKYWDSTFGKIKVNLGDSTIILNSYLIKHTYLTPGKKILKLNTYSTNGCQDSLIKDIWITDIKANVTKDSRTNSCSGYKLLVDSSYCNSISFGLKYYWDFSDGKKSTNKDPFQNFDKNRTYVITHKVIEPFSGCFDSVIFEVRIKKPAPFFTLTKDSIFCDSTTLIIKSNSKFCSYYIWELGDSAKTTKTLTNQDPFSFFYGKPGLYNLKLTGVDTIYNQSTKNYYYCTSEFPGPGEYRTLRILPSSKTNISGTDTICIGNSATFKSNTNLKNDWFDWDFGDGKLRTSSIYKDSVNHTFTMDGKYKVNVLPRKNLPTYYPNCFDSASKAIVVVSAKADFDIDDINKKPLVLFVNNSYPTNAIANWDFGHPKSLNQNYSTLWSPTHDYRPNENSFTVCLKIKTAYCNDELCKTFLYKYAPGFQIGNVFTPGKDGFNDDFDIVIQDEKSYDLTVDDRWGVSVYHSNEDAEPGQNKNWNGRLKNTGPLCTEGTYYFTFKYNLTDDKINEKKISGVITLLR